MKEVKEQCEERIEEVTKNGNEAVASRDLKTNQGQQVTLGIFLPRISRRYSYPFCRHLFLICCLIYSLLLSLMGLVP